MSLIKQVITLLAVYGFMATVYADGAARPFDVREYEEAGLKVYVPLRPQWEVIENTDEKENKTVTLNTPVLYYPQTAIEFRVDRNVKVNEETLSSVALGFVNQMRRDLGFAEMLTEADLKKERYGKYHGFSSILKIVAGENQYDMKVLLLKLNSNHPVAVLLTTHRGQSEHVEHLTNKILSNLSVIEKPVNDKG